MAHDLIAAITIINALLSGFDLNHLNTEFSINTIFKIVSFLSENGNDKYDSNLKIQAKLIKKQIIKTFPIEKYPEMYI